MGTQAERKTSDIAALAAVIAFCAAGVGTARWGLDLGDTWAWAALFIGVFAVGMTMVHLFVGADSFGAVLAALTFAGAAIMCPWVPLAPVVGLGGLVLLMFSA